MRRFLLATLLTLLTLVLSAAGPSSWSYYCQRYPEFAAKLETMDKAELKGLYGSFLDYEAMAALSANCYPDDDAVPVPDGWVLLGEADPAGAIVHSYNDGKEAAGSGFHAELYRRTGRESRYVLAFAGTDDLHDVFGADLFGAIRSDQTQTRLAKALVGELKESLGEVQLWLTGHSLGGRLALEAGVQYMLPAVVFNPASLSRDTKRTLTELSGKASLKLIGAVMRTRVTLGQFTAVYAVSEGDGAVSLDTDKLVSSLGEGLSDMWNEGDVLGGLSKIGSGAMESLEGDLLDALQKNERVSKYIGEEVAFGHTVYLRHAGFHQIRPLYAAIVEHREMIALRLQMM